MGIQDDIFDVEEALKDKPEAAAFQRISTHLNVTERFSRRQQTILKGLTVGIQALRMLLEEK